MLKKYHDFVIETYRNGYCDRFNIQATSLKELDAKLKKEYNLVRDKNCYLAIS